MSVLLTRAGLCLLLVLPVLGAAEEDKFRFFKRSVKVAHDEREETCAPPCQNGGRCFRGICACTPGFYGQFCEYQVEETCVPPCQNGGRCDKEICTCTPGFYGQFCEYNWAMTTENE
ncbi:uncharacterized protein LOC144123502 [Amblyomma americanum]